MESETKEMMQAVSDAMEAGMKVMMKGMMKVMKKQGMMNEMKEMKRKLQGAKKTKSVSKCPTCNRRHRRV